MQQSLSTSGRALGSANMIRTAPSYRWSCRLPSVLGSKRASEHNGAAAPARSRSSVTARASSSPITNWFLKTAGSLINPSSSVSPPAPKRDYLEARQVRLAGSISRDVALMLCFTLSLCSCAVAFTAEPVPPPDVGLQHQVCSRSYQRACLLSLPFDSLPKLHACAPDAGLPVPAL